jgi:hypothetical protein
MAGQPAKKAERMEAFVGALGLDGGDYDPCYLGYFRCFNAGEYYEAHDVLEHLWLQGPGENFAFYKGLIQLAGAFVHLSKQRERPDHPTDGRRLFPAVRLFRLAAGNLAGYGDRHEGLDLAAVHALIGHWVNAIESADYAVNPWTPESAPCLEPAAAPPALPRRGDVGRN